MANTLSLPKVRPDDMPVVISAGFVVVILVLGTIYTLATIGTAPLLTPNYLLTQLQTGSFLGIVAAGMMVVILLGHIDLSVPWTMTAAAMMATYVGGDLAIPTGLAVGLAVGLFNGFGVAYMRIPSMIFTLGVDAVMRGLMVMLTGGFSPRTESTPLMKWLAADKILGIPVAVFVWAGVALVVATILGRTAFGKMVYATGNSESATYLSGVRTRRVVVGAFVISGLCAAVAGMLLAGYSNKAFQGMGTPYLLPAIAAVVLGGTHILGGRGRFIGTLVGVILIVLLNSVVSMMQMPDAARQVIYGLVIIVMLLVYGRTARVTS